jgi:hypothetical protein
MVHGIVAGSLIMLGACAKDEARAKDEPPPTQAERVAPPGLAVGDQVFPSVASVTEYTTYGQDRNALAMQHSAQNDVSLGFAGKSPLRAGVQLDVGLRAYGDHHTISLTDGRPPIRPDLPAGAVDLLELLPPAGARLALHQAYDSPGPDTDYVLAEADHDRLVLWQQMTQEPTAIVTVGDKTVVRVQGRGINRLHYIDDDGSIRTTDLGTAYLHVADLVSIPGQGWQVLRFARIGDVEGADQDPAMDLAQARSHKHATFVVCASRMDVAGPDLAKLHATLVADVPEFAACATK